MRRSLSTAAKLTEQEYAERRNASSRSTRARDERSVQPRQQKAGRTSRGASAGSARSGRTNARAQGGRSTGSAARGQTGSRSRSTSQRTSGSNASGRVGRKARIALAAVAIIVLVCVILYPVGKDYYHSLRDGQRLQAQIDAVNERNQTLEEETDALNTDEGIEAQARDDYNYVEEGENAVVVTNAQSENRSTDAPARIDEDNIQAPQTWYYTILDIVFFYSG